MNCTRCNAEMRPTTAFAIMPPIDVLESTVGLDVAPALECRQCGMIFVHGEWVDGRAEPEDEDDEDVPHA